MIDSSIHSNVKIDFNKKKSNVKTKNKLPLKMPRRWETPLRIVPLWGLEQVWENMMFLEYESDIVIIDAWMLMPGWEVYWVDYIIPDITYLKENKKKIRGILITHGHLDHIWALKHVLPELDFPMVYGTALAVWLIKKTLEGTPHLQYLNCIVINPDIDIISLWCYNIEFFRVNHSIPEPIWIALHTPKWLIVHTWDFKIDFTPAIDKPADLAKISRIGQEWVKLLFSDSTNANKPGRTPSEKKIGEELEKVIKDSNSRLIVATFSSLIWRIAQIIDYAVKYNKIVFLSGRSMINNVEIARQLGYINAPQWVVRKLNTDIDSLPDDKVIILTTGSQWEEFSALVRVAKWEHPQINVRPWDKILLSAVPIPWNETAVISMINELIRLWADIVTNKDLDLHVSWHWYQEDLKMMLSMVKPSYFCPVHWELFMRHSHKKVAEEIWIKSDNIVLADNGSIIEVYSEDVIISENKMKLDQVMIDWLWIWHMSWEYVMKARHIMAEDWMVALIFKVDSKTKDLVWNIQIESRWFVYSSEVKKIHTNIVEFVKKKYYEFLKRSDDVKFILRQIKEELWEYLTKTVWRVPMIIPMFVYINREPTSIWVDALGEDEALVGMTLEEQGTNWL